MSSPSPRDGSPRKVDRKEHVSELQRAYYQRKKQRKTVKENVTVRNEKEAMRRSDA